MKILFVVNPVSGGNSKDDLYDTISALATAHGFGLQRYNTSGEEDEQHIVDHIKQFHPDRIAVAGGDGTVQLVVKAMIKSGKNIPVAIIPMGSANGLATSLDLPDNLSSALDILVRSQKVQQVDLLKINEKHICVHLCDIGTNALLIKNYAENDERGMMGYARFLIKSIQESELLHYRITTAGGMEEKAGYMLIVSNAQKYGTGVHISDGSISDGLFEVRNVRKIDLDAAITAGLTIFNVFIDRDMFSDIIRTDSAEIRITPSAHFQIDGEYMGETNYLKIAIMRSAIQVLIPDDAS